MPKYSQFKYGRAKYGRYHLEIQDGISLGDLTRYRIRTIDSLGAKSRPITNRQIRITGTGGPVKVRLKSKDSPWAVHQSATIKGNAPKARIRAVHADGQSPWLESTKGIIRKRGSDE